VAHPHLLHLFKLYGQREVRDVPVVRRKGVYPTTQMWWKQVEVPRAMAARVPQMVARRGSQLIGEPLWGPYHLMLAVLWADEVADIFLGSIRHQGHIWRRPLAIWSAFADLTTERLCSADTSARPLLKAGLELLRRIDELATASWLHWLGGPRRVFLYVKTLDEEGTLVLSKGLGDPRLQYGKDGTHLHRARVLDRDLADAGWAPVGLVVAPESPSAPAATASAPAALRPPLWGAVSSPAHVPRMSGWHTRARRVYPLEGGSGTALLLGRPAGPHLAPLPLFLWGSTVWPGNWDEASPTEPTPHLGTPRPAIPAIRSSLGRSPGALPSILNNGVDHTLDMALGRATRWPRLCPSPWGSGTPSGCTI